MRSAGENSRHDRQRLILQVADGLLAPRFAQRREIIRFTSENHEICAGKSSPKLNPFLNRPIFPRAAAAGMKGDETLRNEISRCGVIFIAGKNFGCRLSQEKIQLLKGARELPRGVLVSV